jgi:hypothetical protein
MSNGPRIQLTKRQCEALLRSEREVLVGGSRMGGKSTIGREWLREPVYVANPRYAALVIRKNANDLAEWVDKTRQHYGDMAEITGNPAVIRFPAGGIIRTGHLKDEGAFDKYIGHEYQKMLIEELTLIPSELQYLKLISSCRSTIEELPAQVMSNANPGGKGHTWVKRRFVDKAKNKAYQDPESGTYRIFLPIGYVDNPGALKDPAYIGYLNGLPPKLRAAWRDGDWDILTGSFFPEFSDNQEAMREKPYKIAPHECNLYGSLDYGDGAAETSGATVFMLWHLDERRKPHLIFTYYSRGHYADFYAREIAAKVNSCWWTSGARLKAVYADPSIFQKRTAANGQIRAIADTFKEYGLPMVPANNERVNGWRVMREAYSIDAAGEPNSYFFDGENQEYEEYIPVLEHKESQPDDVEKGGEDHVGDCARYFFVANIGNRNTYTTNGNGRIQVAQTEDMESVIRQLEMAGAIGVTGI